MHSVGLSQSRRSLALSRLALPLVSNPYLTIAELAEYLLSDVVLLLNCVIVLNLGPGGLLVVLVPQAGRSGPHSPLPVIRLPMFCHPI